MKFNGKKIKPKYFKITERLTPFVVIARLDLC